MYLENDLYKAWSIIISNSCCLGPKLDCSSFLQSVLYSPADFAFSFSWFIRFWEVNWGCCLFFPFNPVFYQSLPHFFQTIVSNLPAFSCYVPFSSWSHLSFSLSFHADSPQFSLCLQFSWFLLLSTIFALFCLLHFSFIGFCLSSMCFFLD